MLPAAMHWKWAALIPISLVTGIVEAGAAAAVFALIKIIGDPAQIARVPVASRIAAALPGSTARTQLLVFTALIAVYYLVKNLLVIGTQYLRQKIAGESTAALKSTMFKGYLAAAYPFHLGRNSADLISNTNFCVDIVCNEAMEAAVAAGGELLTAAAITVVLLITAPKVTLIAGTFLVVLLAVLLRLTRRMADHFGTQRHQLERDSLRTLQEALGAIKEIKALGREDFFHRSFGDKQRRVLELGYIGKTLENITPPVTETIFVCGALAVVALVTGTGHAGAQGPPLLALFGYAAFRIVPAVNRVGWRVNMVRSASAAVESLYDDYLLVGDADWEHAVAQRQSVQLHEGIALDRVSYTFAGTDTPALQDVSLTIRCGESIGIVGPTGAGKTTLVDLIVGLLRPSSGRILIDGNDLSSHLSAWKRNIGYVPQSIFMIDDSLRRNIALGIGDNEIDEVRVQAAVGWRNWSGSLPNCRRAWTRPWANAASACRAESASASALRARSITIPICWSSTRRPRLWIIATEAAVSQAIEALHGKKTLLVVAHRLSSVRRCDRLVFMSEGRIAACGSYDELLRDHPEFQRLVRAQDRVSPG